MNPHYTKTLPLYQSACGISDILSHLLERYYTNTEYVDTTDYLIDVEWRKNHDKSRKL